MEIDEKMREEDFFDSSTFSLRLIAIDSYLVLLRALLSQTESERVERMNVLDFRAMRDSIPTSLFTVPLLFPPFHLLASTTYISFHTPLHSFNQSTNKDKQIKEVENEFICLFVCVCLLQHSTLSLSHNGYCHHSTTYQLSTFSLINQHRYPDSHFEPLEFEFIDRFTQLDDQTDSTSSSSSSTFTFFQFTSFETSQQQQSSSELDH